jgi:hypothetical protein
MIMKYLSPPKFENEDQSHTAFQLWRIVLTMTVLTLVYSIVWIALVPEFISRIILALPLFPLTVGCFISSGKGTPDLPEV